MMILFPFQSELLEKLWVHDVTSSPLSMRILDIPKLTIVAVFTMGNISIEIFPTFSLSQNPLIGILDFPSKVASPLY